MKDNKDRTSREKYENKKAIRKQNAIRKARKNHNRNA